MISLEELTNLAALARLALDESERGALAHDLEAILGYVDQLKKVQPEKVRPCISPPAGGLRSNLKDEELKENIVRADSEPHPPTVSREFKVKAVF